MNDPKAMQIYLQIGESHIRLRQAQQISEAMEARIADLEEELATHLKLKEMILSQSATTKGSESNE